MTRKGMDRSYASLVKLIYLLHDLRGAVLESIICRTIRTIGDEQQCIIFVHSLLLDKFKKGGADREMLMEEVEDAESDGMTRSDRVLVEDLFKARVLKVLVLIIKGTQIYQRDTRIEVLHAIAE
eukprot:18179_1